MKKKIKVVFKKDVEGLGVFGDVKEVAAGYARNYLIPKGLVLYLVDKRSKEILKQTEEKKKEAEKEIEELKKLAGKIESLELEVKVRVTKEGKLYGAVGSDEIVKALAKKKIKVDKKQIEMSPIKKTGEKEIIVNLGYNIKAKIKIIVKGGSK